MCHLGSPAKKRCVILLAGLVALSQIQGKKGIHVTRLSCNIDIFYFTFPKDYRYEKALALLR